MNRPASIVRFEQFYVGHILAGLAGTIFTMFFANNPALAAFRAQIGDWPLVGGMMFAIATQLLLWFGIARAGWAAAKWVLVVLGVINLLGVLYLLYSLITGVGAEYRSMPGTILSLLGSALLAGAIAMLFRPDTHDWFGEGEEAA